MNVRKIVESYEQESSSPLTLPPSRPGSLRPRPRPRPLPSHNTSFLVAGNQRSIRPQRLPNLKMEGPAAVLRDCTNELQIEPRPNGSRLSVLLTSDTSHTFGYPSITSSKPLRASSALDSPNSSLARPLSPSAPLYGVPSPSRLALQRRANLRMLRQQRYSRDESALAASLKRPAEYERVFPPRPSSQYAVRRLEVRVTDAKARLADVRELLRDETTDQATHQALLRTRWMAERWIAAAEAELSQTSTLSSNSVPLNATQQPLARKTRRDANLTYFFAHSPTRATVLSTQHWAASPPDHPRLISKRDVEPPQLRTWPLTTTLREPMKLKLKTFPSTPDDIGSQPSGATHHPPPSPPVSPRRPDKLDLGSPVSEPSLYTTTSLETPLDDCSLYAWPGFADIYVPHHLSDEELLAALSTDLEEEPMPAYVTYLLDRLEAIGEGVSLPGLSRRESTTSSAFELISRPSVEVYEYPVLPRTRLLVRRSMRFRPPQSRLRILSGLHPVHEDPKPQTSPRSSMTPTQTHPRSSVLDKMRRSMTVRGRE